jgi:hypothetical protein
MGHNHLYFLEFSDEMTKTEHSIPFLALHGQPKNHFCLKKVFFGKTKPTNIQVGPKMVHNVQFVPFL